LLLLEWGLVQAFSSQLASAHQLFDQMAERNLFEIFEKGLGLKDSPA
jgi:hypothetical protein